MNSKIYLNLKLIKAIFSFYIYIQKSIKVGTTFLMNLINLFFPFFIKYIL